MSSPTKEPQPAVPADETVDLGEESDDYDAEFDGEEEEGGFYEEDDDDDDDEEEGEEEEEEGAQPVRIF